MRNLIVAVVLAVALISSTAVAAQAWPQWGGPKRNFKIDPPQHDSSRLAESWNEEGPKRLWSRPLGHGLSAIAEVNGSLYTMYGAVYVGEGEEEGIIAIDAATGATLWDFSYSAKLHHSYSKSFHQGPSSTPLVIQGHVVAIGFTGLLHAVSAESGEQRWSYDLIRDFGGARLRFGHSASPVLYQDYVIVLVGGEQVGLVALGPQDGAILWRSKPFYASYASPILAHVDGQDQIIALSGEEILGVAATSGELLWRAPCRNGFANNASDPIWGAGNLLWLASQPGFGAKVFKLNRKDDSTQMERLWANPEISLHYWNGIRIDDTVYASIGPSGTDFAAIDITNGKILWRQTNQLEKGRPLFADGKLIVLDENGKLLLIKPSPHRLEILAESQVLDGQSRTVPTLVGTKLYVRDLSQIIALDLAMVP